MGRPFSDLGSAARLCQMPVTFFILFSFHPVYIEIGETQTFCAYLFRLYRLLGYLSLFFQADCFVGIAIQIVIRFVVFYETSKDMMKKSCALDTLLIIVAV